MEHFVPNSHRKVLDFGERGFDERQFIKALFFNSLRIPWHVLCLLDLAQMQILESDRHVAFVRRGKMNVAEVIEKAKKDNPDFQLVLDLAIRAREMEVRELPREIGVATEVVAIPTNTQRAV